MEKKEFLLKTIVDCKATVSLNDKYDDIDYDCSIEISFDKNEFMNFLLEQNAKGLRSHGAYTSLEECDGNVVYKMDFSLGKEI